MTAETDTSVANGATAADGLYDDSTGGISDKQITARYAMATYNSAQFLHLGMLMMFPLFLEQTVQRSLWYGLTEIARMLASLSTFFYPFSMQTKAHNFGYAVNYGRAGYVATGRGYAIRTSSMVTLFAAYGPSHIYFGSELVAMLIVYEAWKAEGKDFMSTWSSWSVAASLVLSPWLFNPQALHYSTLWTSWVEWTQWVYGRGNLKVGEGSWVKWAAKRLNNKRNSPWPLKLQILLRNVSTKILVCAACAQGLQLKRAQSFFIWHAIFLFRAIGLVVISSVYLSLAVRTFEGFMQRTHRIRFLPLYSFALVLAAYLAMAMVLLLLEHGTWQGDAGAARAEERLAPHGRGIAAQAGLVQVLGALSDKQRFETTADALLRRPPRQHPRGRAQVAPRAPPQGVHRRHLTARRLVADLAAVARRRQGGPLHRDAHDEGAALHRPAAQEREARCR